MRFGIKAKLTLSFATLVILPALGSQIVTRYIVVERFQREFEARLGAVAEQVRSEFARTGEELAGRAFGLFEGTDQSPTFLDRYLAELRQGPLSTRSQRDLIVALPAITKAAGIDVLKIIDKNGYVIAQTPLRGREGHKDNQAMMFVEKAPHLPALVWERLPDQSGGAEERLMLEVGIEVTRYGSPIYAIAGREINPAFLKKLVGQSGADILLEDQDQKPIIGDPSAFQERPSRRIPLPGFSEDQLTPDLYALVTAISDQNQREAVAQISLGSGAIVAGGVIFAWILGFVLARRLTRPIDDLVRRAGEVARGELKGEIPRTRNDEVGALIESFNEMTRRLDESQERLKHAERVAAWQEIARRLAHEIKNPLFPIQMSVETLKKTFGHRDFQEIFEESTTAVLEEVERLKKIVSEFSQFARMPEPEFAPVDVAQSIQAALRLCAAANADAGITVEADLEENLPLLSADKEQLSQVFLNLLANAREAMPQGGILEVKVKHHRDEILVSISDTGVGLSEEARARIFTPYYTTKEKGTGLGLAIAHRIVASHGGRITVESSPGQGTTFTLYFPLSEQQRRLATPPSLLLPGERGRYA